MDLLTILGIIMAVLFAIVSQPGRLLSCLQIGVVSKVWRSPSNDTLRLDIRAVPHQNIGMA